MFAGLCSRGMPARSVKSRNKTVRDTPEVPKCSIHGFIRTARNDVHYSACPTSDARSRLPEVEQLNSTCSLVWGSGPSKECRPSRITPKLRGQSIPHSPSASNSFHFGKDRARCSTLQLLLGKASGWRTRFTLQHVRSIPWPDMQRRDSPSLAYQKVSPPRGQKKMTCMYDSDSRPGGEVYHDLRPNIYPQP
ncbi:hypothetical protein LX32DRAFT_298134 [Colletotrichum zoysiae]|uniref:Uncharacterized protein n=1 Tax=Colletotrichum zoysiae TaxID=1216348 RepID=A0AAD9H374_9PEZI|nr:hypothetical protein LX32DRAFT_298134 [Colletotrichum zoysiae]